MYIIGMRHLPMISMLYNEVGDFLFHLTAELASLVSLKGQHAVLLLHFYVLLHRMLGLGITKFRSQHL